MLALARTKKIRQKEKILADLYTQNLRLVGKASQRKKTTFDMGWSIWLAVLIFISAFIATENLDSGLRQGLTMRSNPSRQAPVAPAQPDFQPEPAAAPLPEPEEIMPEPRQYVSLLAEILGGGEQAREYAGLLTPGIEGKNEMQEYVNLFTDNPVPIKRMFGLDVKTIIIDAGHGGKDPGAIGIMGTQEKEITLDIARTLKQRLESTGQCRVILTRSNDTFIGLKERTVIANENAGDLFVSIHVNFLPGRSMNIIETMYFGPPKNQTEMQLAEKENKGSGFSISDYNHLVKKLSSTMKLQESRVLAQSIQQHLFQSMYAANQQVRNFGIRRAPFVVLLGAEMPGVLVEVSCLSNHNEEQRLRDPAYREAIAGYIEAGVIKYLESRSRDYDQKRADRDIERDIFRRN